MNRFLRMAALVAGIILTSATLLPPIASAATVTVVVNGQTVAFDQPPIQRAGRVFVPLRGVFERLGASVVYANGLINANGNGRSISLHIGSTQAIIDGQTQYIDVAPFLIGARTLVPLRFVAQALGAAVAWDQGSSTVNITGGGNGGGTTYTPPPNQSFYLNNMRPTGTVNTLSPAIHAGFSEPVQSDSVRVAIDGVDVTGNVYVNTRGFDVTPTSLLQPGGHRVRVSGTTAAGSSFATGWAFSTANGSTSNYIRGIQPGNNARVSGQFAMSGRTLPNSNVHIAANGSAGVLGGIFQVGTGTFQTDVVADANGRFTADVSINAVAGGRVTVLVQSTSPGGASAEQTVIYNT
jgi:hypothetical protein